MSLDTLFTFELVLVAPVIIGTVAGAVYIGLHDRRIRRQTGRLVRIDLRGIRQLQVEEVAE